MDPIHLTTHELEYELNIRGIFNLSNRRLKTSSLRESLEKEKLGLSKNPTDIEGLFKSVDEIKTCSAIYLEVIERAEDTNCSELTLNECRSRLTHLNFRLSRIRANSEKEQATLDSLIQCASDAITKISKTVVPTAQKRAHSDTPGTLIDLNEANEEEREEEGALPLLTRRNSAPVGEPAIQQADSNFRHIYTEVNKSLNNRTSVSRILHNQQFAQIDSVFATGNHSPQQRRRKELETALNPKAKEFRPSNAGVLNPFSLNASGSRPSFSQPNLSNFQRNSSPSRNDAILEERFPQRDVHQPNRTADRFRKTVPVHQWRVTFSGDGKGMHLYDFFSRVALYQRSERIDDDDLLSSVFHLLSGRASYWYEAEGDQFCTWEDFKAGMKQEFLPPNYDYSLLSDISNRTQKSNESFSEYMMHMQSLFRCLAIELSEDHKLFIVKKNLLPKYAIGIAPMQFNSLAELSNVCRRMDSVYKQTQQQIPFQDSNRFARPYDNKQRTINQLEAENDNNDVDSSDRFVCDLHKPRSLSNINERDNQPSTSHRSKSKPLPSDESKVTCYNCSQTGHTFSECSQPRKGKFCFRCGKPDVTCPTCPKCLGNEKSSPTIVAAKGSTAQQRPQ